MLGREKLDQLSLVKQALLLESGLNRLALQAEIKSLRSASSWVGEAARASREFAPFLIAMAPVAGFLMARGSSRRPDSWFKRVVTAAKWIVPLYRFWKGLSAGRKQAELTKPAA